MTALSLLTTAPDKIPAEIDAAIAAILRDEAHVDGLDDDQLFAAIPAGEIVDELPGHLCLRIARLQMLLLHALPHCDPHEDDCGYQPQSSRLNARHAMGLALERQLPAAAAAARLQRTLDEVVRGALPHERLRPGPGTYRMDREGRVWYSSEPIQECLQLA